MPRSRRRPVEAEDLLALAIIDEPRLSPDGETVAYTHKAIDAEANVYRSAIWAVPFVGGEAHQLTSGTGKDRAPAWSPDGRWLAFLSDRGGDKSQIYVMPTAFGEARQITHGLNGIGDVVWSPTSDRLAFVARIRPEGVLSIVDGPAPPPVREISRIKYRFDGQGLHDGRNHLFVVNLSDGAPRQITDGDWDDSQPAWSPDSETIAFASNRTAGRDWNDASSVYAVPASGGRVRAVTRGGYALGAPAWSPDGATIACIGRADDRAGANVNLWTVRASGGDPICLTASADLSLGSDVISDLRADHATPTPIWSDDGSRLRFIASERGNASLYEIDCDGGEPRRVIGGDRVLLEVSIVGERVAFTATSPLEPGDVFVASTTGSGERRLTDANRDLLDGLDLVTPEHLDLVGANGQPIDGWFVAGRGRGRRPLLLQVHGGPHALYGNALFHEFQLLAARGYRVLYTNPRGSRGYGERFCSEIAGAWGELDYQDLMSAVDQVVARRDVDPNRLGVLGRSYGGFMTNWIVGHTDRFKAAITMRCLSNMISFYGTSDIGPWFSEREFGGSPRDHLERYWQLSPLAYVERVTTPVLVLHSEQDLRCPIEQAEQWFVSLRRLGKVAEFVRFPEENHNLSRSGRPDRRLLRLGRIVEWLDRWLT